MLNTVGFIGIKKNGMKFTDPQFIELLDYMIKTQKDPEYRQRHIQAKESLLKRKD